MAARGARQGSPSRGDVPAPVWLPGRVQVGQVFAVGSAVATVVRFLAEGAFAHVYLAETGDGEQAVLKRVVVPDEEKLLPVMREIQVMRDVARCDKIVQLIDAGIDSLPQGGFEALLLMEYCPGGHIVELMNARLQTRLREDEILQIFSDTCEAVACLHYQDPPIVHRDIKVENILVSAFNTYKLCDFGSCTVEQVPENAPINSRRVAELEDDIGRNTTLQYRAPEMIDLYQRMGLTEKTDIWALGVLLYKLCFFVTPFDDGNKLAILNCRYQIPSQPSYSPGLVNLIKNMMQLQPWKRPNIYGVLAEVSKLRRKPCPIPNIYRDLTSTTRGTMAGGPVAKTNGAFGDSFGDTRGPPVAAQQQSLRTEASATDMRSTSPLPPDGPATAGQPMRRGRPTGAKGAPRAPPSALLQQYVDSPPAAPPSASMTTPPSQPDFFAAFPNPGEASTASFDAFSDASFASFPPIPVADPLQTSADPFQQAVSAADPLSAPPFSSSSLSLPADQPRKRSRSRSPTKPAKSLEDMISSAVADLSVDSMNEVTSAPSSFDKKPTLFEMLGSSSSTAAVSNPSNGTEAMPPAKPPRSRDVAVAKEPSPVSAADPSRASLDGASTSPASQQPNLFDLLGSSSSSATLPAAAQAPTKSVPALPPKPAALRGTGITARLQSVVDRIVVSPRAGSRSPERGPARPASAASNSSSSAGALDFDDDAEERQGVLWSRMQESEDEGQGSGDDW